MSFPGTIRNHFAKKLLHKEKITPHCRPSGDWALYGAQRKRELPLPPLTYMNSNVVAICLYSSLTPQAPPILCYGLLSSAENISTTEKGKGNEAKGPKLLGELGLSELDEEVPVEEREDSNLEVRLERQTTSQQRLLNSGECVGTNPLKEFAILKKPLTSKTIHTMFECNYVSSRERPERRKTRHDGLVTTGKLAASKRPATVRLTRRDRIQSFQRIVYKYPG